MVNLILDTDLVLTSCQAKEIPNEVHNAIRAGVSLLNTLLLVSGSGGNELEQSKAQNEK